MPLSANMIPYSQVVIGNAELVSKQGWSVSNLELRKSIKNDGKKFINSFLNTAVKPYETIFQKDSLGPIDEVPRIFLTKNDNHYALAYAKYLESQNKIDEAVKIYKTILVGLKKANSNGAHSLGLMYRVVIERLTTESIKEGLDHNIYSQKHKIMLYDILAANLLLDTKLIYQALEDDRYYLKKKCASIFFDNNGELLHYKNVNMTINEENLTKEVCQKICIRTDKMREEYNKKLYEITNEKEYKNLKNEIKINQRALDEELAEIENKSPKEIDKLKADPNNFINTISDILYYVSLPHFGILKLDMLQNIESNKRLLNSF